MSEAVLVLAPLDQLWLLTAGCLVFLMQAGFLCVEAGFSRAKHTMNVAVKNLTDYVAASIAFFAVGYGLMFGRTWQGLVGVSQFALTQSTDGEAVFLFFQLVFCGTAATIVSGAMAERMKFGAYLIYSFAVSTIFYPVFGHWVWGGSWFVEQQGWLARLGYLDFAGSSVVHQMGGWLALAGIVVLGPRRDKFDAEGRPRRLIGHNIPLAMLGVFLLWAGWFGFNGGSTLHFNALVGTVVVNTNLAGAVGSLSALAVGWRLRKRADLGDTANGALGGLVAVTASAAYVSAGAALLIGAVAGVLVVVAGEFIERRLKLDDVVGAVAVHGVCGFWGVLAVALFADPAALLRPESRLYHLGVQALGSAVCFAVAFGGGWIFFTLLDRIMGIRVSAEAEQQGLNLSEHGAETELHQLITAMREIATTKDWSRRAVVDLYGDGADLGVHFNVLLETIERQLRRVQEQTSLATLSGEALQQANQDLQAKVKELELLNGIMMGREERIVELKEQVRVLQARLQGGGGLPARPDRASQPGGD
jgi:Amt family ammonium transporter